MAVIGISDSVFGSAKRTHANLLYARSQVFSIGQSTRGNARSGLEVEEADMAELRCRVLWKEVPAMRMRRTTERT
jgi:hypothetical protein